MGAENSVLEGCDWGPQLDTPPRYMWELFPVTKPDGTQATVFQPKNMEGKDVDFLKKCSLVLRGIRHPNIIRFIGCGESSDDIWLATESVSPISSIIQDLSSEELILGLYDLLQGLDFLHSKLGICHNNLCALSVYVASDGTWKIGGMEHACKFTDATQEFLERCRAFRHEDSLSPEEKTSNVKVDGSLGHARDIFAFGAFVDTILEMVKEKDGDLIKLEQQLSVCVNPDPASRPKVSQLLNLPVFRSDFIDIVNFLKNIAVKSDSDKKTFFSTLMPRLHKLPQSAIARRLVVPLLARFVLLNEWADQLVLPHLFIPQSDSSAIKSVHGLLSKPLYQQYVIGHIYNIFHVHDSHIRLILLEHFSHYVHLFSMQQLEDDIFLQILLGVRDSDDRIVAASLRALADLVPILGGDFVIGGSRKMFFFHGIPKQVSPEDLHKMQIPKNMSSVLSSHDKPLLKDLASGSLSSKTSVEKNLSSEEKERRAKEKERRREEARLKREERKRLMKEKQKEEVMKEEIQTKGDSKISGLTIEQMAYLDEDDAKLKNHIDSNVNNHNENKEFTDDGDKTAENPDWSDWDEEEQRIRDEIELELQNISIAEETEPKVQTSPSPYRSQPPPSPPPVKVDWSDVPETLWEDDKLSSSKVWKGTNGGSGGPLSLGSKNKTEVQTEKNSTLNQMGNGQSDSDEAGDWGNDNWDSSTVNNTSSSPKHEPVKSKTGSSPVGTKSLKLKSGVSSKAPAPPKKPTTDDLGMGLDIKSIEIKAKSVSSELDFFADMAPSLPRPKDLTSLLESAAVNAKSDSDNMSTAVKALNENLMTEGSPIKNNKTLFAVSMSQEEDTAGWGADDDLDWGSENF